MTRKARPDGDPGKVEMLDEVVIRFAGDSGDGMQVTGDRFTAESSLLGNDLATFPNYPAEIRAPAGTLGGVSAFQIHISDHEIFTPGDAPNVLVAMNSAALKANVKDLSPGAIIVVNVDSFDDRALAKAGYEKNPLKDGSLSAFRVYEVPMTTLTVKACQRTGANPREAERSKNFFALGLLSWLYHRPVDNTETWISRRYGSNPNVVQANILALRAGYNFGETAEVFEASYDVGSAEHEPGTYTNVTGNTALAWGLIAAAWLAKLPLFVGSYPITPASDILHELSKHKNFGVRTLQAEDEIAGIGAALGAAYGGSLGVTTTSGPGLDLKSEMVGLAVSLELPLIIVDVQRGGPSTGLPTKSEQSDLLHVMYGRHGEAPVPVVAARSSAHCFDAAIEAARIALRYRTPVYLLSDGYLANGSEPWRLPEIASLPDISVPFATELNATDAEGQPTFWPFLRDPETLARPWAIPGTPGLEHRIGGLEKKDGPGTVAYDPANHQKMIHLRAAKIAGIQKSIPPVEAEDPKHDARVLIMSWGSTYAAVIAGVNRVRKAGKSVARLHLVHLNPFPPNLGEVLRSYDSILVPEGNLGHLTRMLRAEFLVDAKVLSNMLGSPFRNAEIEKAILDEIKALKAGADKPHAPRQAHVRGRTKTKTKGRAASGHAAKEISL